MRDIVKFGMFLLIVSGVAGLGVGYVNSLTGPLIAQQILQNKINSFKEVYPRADKVENETANYLKDNHNPMVKEVDIAYREGAPAGVIYGVETKGYGGTISLLAGFDIASGKITAIKVLSQKETPGLGAKSKEKFFQDRYRDKSAASPLEVTKTEPVRENQIQAITASTITSKAVAKGVNAAREHFAANFAKVK
jgi:H+/Na+-translocating ferredoxin:NAD+ oxidoreductase subunit G